NRTGAAHKAAPVRVRARGLLRASRPVAAGDRAAAPARAAPRRTLRVPSTHGDRSRRSPSRARPTSTRRACPPPRGADDAFRRRDPASAWFHASPSRTPRGGADATPARPAGGALPAGFFPPVCYAVALMSRETADRGSPAEGSPDLSLLPEVGRRIVEEELSILGHVRGRLERDASATPDKIEDLDAQLIELRDAIAEAKEEDVPS